MVTRSKLIGIVSCTVVAIVSGVAALRSPAESQDSELAKIIFYSGENFTGRSLELTETTPDFPSLLLRDGVTRFTWNDNMQERRGALLVFAALALSTAVADVSTKFLWAESEYYEDCCEFDPVSFVDTVEVDLYPPVRPSSPSALSCYEFGDYVYLQWTNNGPYAEVRVYRGYQEIAVLPGGDTAYFEAAPVPMPNAYQVLGVDVAGEISDYAVCYP